MNIWIPILGIVLIVFLVIAWIRKSYARWRVPHQPMGKEDRRILQNEIAFYRSLSEDEKKRFEYKVQEFLLNCTITGIESDVNKRDQLLVASSAIIPIFAFDNWRYTDLHEVLLYPGRFNRDFETEGEDRRVLGMVGNGPMNGTMILSKTALELGFKNETDKKNTAVHEFVHLIDKGDGSIDGVPDLLLEKQYSIPWIDLIHKKIEEIYTGKTGINPYGATNRAEFFAVISEYFFERPRLLKKHHPDLYGLLKKIFKQDMARRNFRRKPNKARSDRQR